MTNDEVEYNMKHKGGRGYAVYFGFEEFKGGRAGRRPWVDEEIKIMRGVYQALGFDEEKVIMIKDLTLSKLTTEIKKLQRKDFTNLDSILITVSSHGDGEHFLTYDSSKSISDFIAEFCGNKIKGLAGKPKLFLFQCCRGSNEDLGTEFFGRRNAYFPDTQTPEIIVDSGPSYTLPTSADLLIALSSTKGYPTFHSKSTPFFHFLAETLKTCNLQEEDFPSVIVTAFRNLAENWTPFKTYKDLRQMPTLTSTLTRNLYMDRKKSRPTFKGTEKLADLRHGQ